MIIDINEIKRLYSNPIKSPPIADSTPCDYCIGGALIKYMTNELGMKHPLLSSDDYFFPDESELISVLLLANANLDEEDARHYAYLIINNNDDGLFNLTWEILAEALAFGDSIGANANAIR